MPEIGEAARFQILGPLRVCVPTRDVLVSAGRERVVLTLLLLHANQVVPVARLVDAVWGDRLPHNDRNQLQGCVSRLRRQLADAWSGGDQAILTEQTGYRIRVDPCQLDLLEFRRLREEARAAAAAGHVTVARDRYRSALSLWRGPALADIDRDPVRQLATGLDEERSRVLEERIDVDLTLGAGGELVGELTDLVNRYPYRERLHAALMLALHRADRSADALAAYRRIRRVLVEELGQEPGPTLQQLHQRILAGDSILRQPGPSNVTAWTGATGATGITGGSGASSASSVGGLSRVAAPPAPPANHSLPRTIADFTGRAADLAWLVDAAEQADPYAPVVLAVDGMPGVGKSSLVIHAAHLLARHYPDGQLFLDLHGHSAHRPVEPAAALDTLLRQLGVPATHIPAGLDERLARWRTMLADRRVLVVLDNATSSSQVAPLLPTAAGSLALVTSRRRLVDLDGAQPWSLGMLHPDDAVGLLERVAGPRVRAEPEAAAEVAARCGHLPLALRLAAARLAHRSGWRVRDLADRLSGPSSLGELTAGDRTVTDAFTLSYAHLAPACQRMFRLLGLPPGTQLDVYAAAALADVGVADAQHLLDELVDGHLIQEPHPGRYRLHDLVKTFAASLAEATDPPAEREAAVVRLLDHYVHATAAACTPLESANSRRNFQRGEPKRPDLIKERGTWDTDWLEAERPNLTAAVSQAAAYEHYQYAWQLARAMWRFLYERGYLDDLIATQRCGLAAAEQLGDTTAAATMHNYLGSAYFQIGEYGTAAEHVERAVAQRRQAGDRIGEVVTRRNLATVYAEAGHHRDAIRESEGALARARILNVNTLLASGVVNAGHVYLRFGRYDTALRYSRFGLALAREVGDDDLRVIALGNIGAIRARLGCYLPARRLLLAALRARQRISSRYGEADVLTELGVVHRVLGDIDAAADCHRRALTVARESGYRQAESAAHHELGRTLQAAGDPAAALVEYQQALDIAVRMRHPFGQARALDSLAACLGEEDPVTARQYLQRALRLYQELDVPERYDTERRLAALAIA